MRNGIRWLIAIALTLAAIGLVAYARGDEHKRGDEVGALPAAVVLRSEVS